MLRHNLRVIAGGLSLQVNTKSPPHAPAPRIASGITIRGEFIRFSPALRQKLAAIAAEAPTPRRPGGAA
jgi:hypothetical protein